MAWRIAFLALFVLLGLTAIGFRAYQIQVADAASFHDRALQNQTRVEGVPAPRGRFLDREGRVLAESRHSTDVYLLDPRRRPKGAAFKRLAEALGLSPSQLEKRLPKRQGASYYLPRLIREEVGARAFVRLLEDKIYLPSVVPRRILVRHYLYESLAAHLLGRVGRIQPEELDAYLSEGYSPDALIGVSGLEKRFEEVLRGERGLRTYTVDALGWPQGGTEVTAPRPGGDVRLSLDLEIQAAMQRALGSRTGAIAMVDPETGDVLGLASSPGFDPNHFHRRVSLDEWTRLASSWTAPLLNRATEATYQPGSTFKVVVALAALDAGVSPDESIECTGKFQLGKRIAKCWRKRGHGEVSLRRALASSCNVYFYTMGLRAGIERIEAVGKALGLGRPSELGVGFEKGGVLPGPAWREARSSEPWTKGDTVNVSIGQGEVLVTPLQMARLMGAIEKNGVLMKPRLVLGIHPFEAEPKEIPAEVASRHDFEGSQLDPLLEGLRGAVRRGTATRTRIDQVDIYGKTGSAQNPAGDTHAWFVGVMRLPERAAAIAVLLENAGGGGKEAAPVAKKVFQAALASAWAGHRPKAGPQGADPFELAFELAPPSDLEEIIEPLELFLPEDAEATLGTTASTQASPGTSAAGFLSLESLPSLLDLTTWVQDQEAPGDG